jgi:hypothetical protein
MASQSRRICVADSSSSRHLSQVGSSVNPNLVWNRDLIYIRVNQWGVSVELQLEMIDNYVGSEVLRAVVKKSTFFWDITPYNPLKISDFSEGNFASISFPRLFTLVFWLIPRPWRWRRHVLPKRRLSFSGLHGIVSRKKKSSEMIIIYPADWHVCCIWEVTYGMLLCSKLKKSYVRHF